MLFLAPSMLWADEGMWLMMFIKRLNHEDMQKKGLHLTAEEIYSVNNSSLKDAVVHFDGGCSAEIISNEGLILTNHHCGYEAIAELSTPEHDYLNNGFWAKSKDQELKPKSLNVRFLDKMDDVTNRIQSRLDAKMSEKERQAAIKDEIAKIEKEWAEGGKYVANVATFFNGNEFYVFRYKQYNDVRLVGTPPQSIGKFGGDTDNWEWPRHTGDFSMFRVYGDANGNPAEYSASNVPLKPKHFFPVSLKGTVPNDYAMIIGFPGRTNRYMMAEGIDQNIKYAYPAWVDASKAAMDGMKPSMDAEKAVQLDYADKYARISNYWKNRQGMIDALTAHKTVKAKAKEEKKLQKWINKTPERKAEYGNMFNLSHNFYGSTGQYYAPYYHLVMMTRGSDLLTMPMAIEEMGKQKAALSEEQKKQPEINNFSTKIVEAYENIHPEVEKKILVSTLKSYFDKVPQNQQSGYLKGIKEKYNGNYTAFINDIASQSIFFNKEKVLESFNGNEFSAFQLDPFMTYSQQIVNEIKGISAKLGEKRDDLDKANRLYFKAMREMNPTKAYYPDANSTMRLTYGTVKTLPINKKKPIDAKNNYYTTLAGTVSKYKPNDLEFDLPKKLIELEKAKDYGQYADKDGSLHVCFLTDNDITGGNSGSPVLDGNGNLIGAAFDGNIEAMSGDVVFEQKLQRTIVVDIRYVLFIIDKFAGAQNLIQEMKIVK